ncbi:hypothetical protein PF005_g20465 [Phytophthora fragariae]|uniref:DUF6818 domain-containing protein n=1 Tax=Phytophthora fragariae TaxID=53985 RepID=A0A6A3EAH1_9STRA|nr:hypothetical protein PF003_g7044 [Phytophthora fragariae]KAE8928040.1 hypothetical protein PF009_g21805 [Phytophthora fragariae]KAE8977571.1 hypothetical protein PF011_g23600 [Phytophthora fragariae]KAE9087730.1 hypothetical protein PF010_g19622 [Phytophthora fragariae]KAE9088590.1 hypothetical protein PF007_g19918 [Phytophthora fragariae]
MTRRPTSGRGKGFTTRQVDRMLAFVETFLPLGTAQCDGVQYAFNRNIPAEWPQRDPESLRRKFFALKNTRKPTGDATCPPEVRRAKAIYRDIEGKCSVVELEDEVAEVEAEGGTGSLPTAARCSASTSCTSTTDKVDVVASSTDEPSTSPSSAVMDSSSTTSCTPNAGPTVDRGADSATTSMVAGGTICTPTKGPLKATPRTGKTPEQLAVLSNQLKRQREDQVTLSQTAKTRVKIDNLLHELANPSTELPQMLLMMEERAHQRELRYRQEKDEREEKREVERRRIRDYKAQRELERSEREAQLHEVLMTMLGSALSKK